MALINCSERSETAGHIPSYKRTLVQSFRSEKVIQSNYKTNRQTTLKVQFCWKTDRCWHLIINSSSFFWRPGITKLSGQTYFVISTWISAARKYQKRSVMAKSADTFVMINTSYRDWNHIWLLTDSCFHMTSVFVHYWILWTKTSKQTCDRTYLWVIPECLRQGEGNQRKEKTV